MKIRSQLQIFLLSLLALSVYSNSLAQDKRLLRGKVSDLMLKEPLIGVNIVAMNDNERSLNGTITDINGNFMLEVTDEASFLKISYIGYKALEFKIENRSEFNVEMQEDVSELESVNVTARKIEKQEGGIDMINRRDMTGASSRVTLGDVTQTPVSNVGQVLQGRASGVSVTAFSGDPGAGLQIRVRGETSLTGNNEPLYVIDGMPLVADGANSGLSNMEYNPISDIPPEEIESIEVLKDASAVALWGTRAANGVVIINTKRGEKNKTSVGVSSRFTLKVPQSPIPMLSGDEYKTLMNEADQNRGGDLYHTEVVTNLRDNPANAQMFQMHNNNTDWNSEIEELGYIQNHTFNISGGGNTARYRFSTSFEDNTGPVVTTAYQRFNTSFNLDYDVSKKMSMSTNIAYTNAKTDLKDVVDPDKIIPRSVQNAALKRAPTWPVYWQDASGNTLQGQYAFQDVLVNNDKTLTNPVAFINNKISEKQNHRIIGKAQLRLRPVNGLTITGDLGGDYSSTQDFFFIPPTATGAEPGDIQLRYNKLRYVDTQVMKIYGRFTTNYAKTFNELHNINFTFYSSIDLNNKETMAAGGNNIASDKTPSMSTAANYAGKNGLTNGFNESVLTSTGGRLQYKLKDRYIVGGSVSVDGSSKFGPDNRYAILPTLSGRWRVSSEWFLENAEWLNDLSLVYSWGKTGNGAIHDYLYYSRYSSTSDNSYLGIGGVNQSNVRLDNIKWETTAQQNVGFSSEMKLSGRTFNIESYYYRKYTTDLLVRNSKLPSSSGFGALSWYNSGDVLNQGFELEFSYDIIRNNNIHWGIDFNISTLKNQVMKLPDAGEVEGVDSKAGNYYWRLVEGDPLGSFYGYRFKGVYAHDGDAVVRDAQGNVVYNLGGYDPNKPHNNAKVMRYGDFDLEGGDAIYEDINGDGVIDELDIVKIGDVNPELFGGFNTNFTYKNISMILFFQYSYGNDIINLARRDVEQMSDLNNQSTATIRRWRTQGDVTDMPKAAHQYKSNVNTLPSDRFVEDGSYLRLKNIQISYEFSSNLKKRLNIRSGRLFCNITNLFTWTNYIGQDPEVNGKGNRLRGIDLAYTAQPIMYTVGLSLSL